MAEVKEKFGPRWRYKHQAAIEGQAVPGFVADSRGVAFLASDMVTLYEARRRLIEKGNWKAIPALGDLRPDEVGLLGARVGRAGWGAASAVSDADPF